MNKWIGISLGTLLGISHIGMISFVATRQTEPPLPSVDLPVGPYTSYKVSVSDEDMLYHTQQMILRQHTLLRISRPKVDF